MSDDAEKNISNYQSINQSAYDVQLKESQVTQAYNRKLYEDKTAMNNFKEMQFGDKRTIKNPYNDKILHKSHKAARNKYGSNASSYQAETDHINPLKHIHEETSSMSYITDADIKIAANRDGNLKVIDKKLNTSKKDKTNFEASKDKKLPEKIKMNADGLKAEIQVFGELFSKDIGRAALDGAMSGAIEGGQIIATMNIAAVMSGDKTVGEALKDTAIGTAQTTVTSAGVKAGTELAKVSLKNAEKALVKKVGEDASRHLISKGLSETCKVLGDNIGTVVSVAMTVGNSIFRYVNGEITAEGMIMEMGEAGTGMAAMAIGKEIGGIIGCIAGSAFPLVGNVLCMVAGEFIGGAIGYLVGSKAFQALQKALTKPSKAEEKRRMREMYEQVKKKIEESRRELEQYLQYIHADHRQKIMDAFQNMHDAILADDVEAATLSLGQICSQYNIPLAFETKKEFNNFMEDPASSLAIGRKR